MVETSVDSRLRCHAVSAFLTVGLFLSNCLAAGAQAPATPDQAQENNPHRHWMHADGRQGFPRPGLPMHGGQAAPAKPNAALPAASPVPATWTAPQASAPQPNSLLQQPPTQAVIVTEPDTLKIEANNASLTQTLQRIAEKTGMHLDGTTGDERVFGTFGPGAPRDVIGALLEGTSYNIAMVGSLENGAPRELLLSPKSGAGGTSPALTSKPLGAETMQPEDDAPQDVPTPVDDSPAMPAPRQLGGPGGGPDQPRNPQELLQQLREAQQNQQNQQQ